MPHVSPQLAELLGDSLGIAAVLLVIGWIALRWQQDRQRFTLMQTALEKGITQFPNSPPFWLVSLRQGFTMLALGGALVVVGAGVFYVGKQVPTPSSAAIAQDSAAREAGPRDRGPEDGPPEEGPPPRPRPGDQGPPGRFGNGPDRLPPDRMSPDRMAPDRLPPRDRGPGAGDRPRGDGPDANPERRPPPRPNPELERWHHAQIEQISGMVATGVGVILVVVGLMRVTFARTERFYATDPTRMDNGL